MKNTLKNKGKSLKLTTLAFTLIELLAVIVILAVIALIATPIILGIVEDAKKDAFLRSVELLVSTTDIDIATKPFEESYTYEITDGNISGLELGVKNTDGMNGSITYDMEGKEEYVIHNGVYCVRKTDDMASPEISDYSEETCVLYLETPSKYFTYVDYISLPVTIEITDFDKCVELHMGWDDSYELATSICNNEPTAANNGLTLKEALYVNLGYALDLKDAIRIIDTPQYEITDFDKCVELHMGLNNSYELATSICNNEPTAANNGLTLKEALSFDSSYALFLKDAISVIDASQYEITNIDKCVEFYIGPEQGLPEELAISICNNEPTELNYGLTLKEALSFDFYTAYLLGKKGAITQIPSTLKIIDYSEKGPKNVIIPEYIDGKRVVAIGEKAFSDMDLTHVKLNDAITDIDICAFCYNNISETNKNEIKVKYPLAIIEPQSEICFDYEDVSGGVSITGYKCEQTDVVIPSTINGKNVVKIGQSAFRQYRYGNGGSYGIEPGILTKVILPDTVTYIDNYAFYFNNKIGKMLLSKKLEYIGDYAFQYNKLNDELDLSNTKLISIGKDAFCNNKIETIKFPSSLTMIGDGAFAYNKIHGELDLSNTQVTSIGYGAFEGNDDGTGNQIISVKLPNSVTTIGEDAFGYNLISKITMSYENVTIGDYSFCDHQLLETSTEYQNINTINPDALICKPY